MARVEGMLALHEELHGHPGRPQRHVSDVLRGSLVLALAALDSLVVDSVVEGVGRISAAGALGKTAEKWAKDRPGDVLSCFGAADPHEALAQIAREELGAITFQRSEAIAGVMVDALGCERPWERAAVLLNAEVPGENWTAEDVTEYLDRYVQRRNRIAHSGDVPTGKTRPESIRRSDVALGVRVVTAVGEAVAYQVSHRIRNA
jgi:hypothetical protein